MVDGYMSLASSLPTAVVAVDGPHGARAARPSMELTNTKETKAWEGLAIGAVTLARTFSTGSHRFCRSGSERRSRSRSGLPGALRRAFSMRRFHPAGPGGCGAGDGYWRIHDMDGDSDDRGGDYDTVEEHGEDEAAAGEEAAENKKAEQQRERDEDAANGAVAGEEDVEGKTTTTTTKKKKKKKKRGGILKACKKLFRL